MQLEINTSGGCCGLGRHDVHLIPRLPHQHSRHIRVPEGWAHTLEFGLPSKKKNKKKNKKKQTDGWPIDRRQILFILLGWKWGSVVRRG